MNGKRCRSACVLSRKAKREFNIILEGFTRDLRHRGYRPDVLRAYGLAAEHFGRWLCQKEIRPSRIRQNHIQAFLGRHLSRCRCPSPRVKSLSLCRAALGRFVDFLQRRRVLPDLLEKRPILKAIDRVIFAFDQHLDRVQGLSATTRRARRRYARELLVWRFGQRPLRLRAVQPSDLFRFVNVRGRTLNGTSLHALTVGLRSFLRFLEFTGRIRQGLVCAVPSPASPPPHQPPRVLDRGARLRFLHSFDRATPIGRRNYAIALCLSELALRANEVVDLTLDDVDWRAQTLRLRQTKQRRERILPLASRVAQALAEYLQRGRPTVVHRAIFVRHCAPIGQPLHVDGLRQIIRRAFTRCGLETTGPHILRRTWATTAYQRGADLKLIADILGHGSVDSTTPYTQVHFEELRQAALPWPRNKP
jgi:site-specific recombinase XerD